MARLCLGRVASLCHRPTIDRYQVLHPTYRARVPQSSPADTAASPARAPMSPTQGVRAVTWLSKLRMLLQCATGMAFLHGCSPRVLHRDLKSANVLVRRGDGVVKVCDFGLSVHRDAAAGRPTATRAPGPASGTNRTNGGTFSSRRGGEDGSGTPRGMDRDRMTSVQQHAMAIGTCQWSAPEVLREEPHSAAGDVWSFGVIAWETASPSPPFAGMSAMRVAAMVAYCNARLPMPPVLGASADDTLATTPSSPASVHTPPSATGAGGDAATSVAGADRVTVGGADELIPAPRGLVVLLHECLADEPSARPSFRDIVGRLQALVAQHEG